ncbi:amidohydrolase [Bacillus rubiinfantis]|uniref:amidohydrolase n=1 Tax=Bacillus rubiinfantis TaxID=1499680 RepID=UPI0005AAC5C4|nr:amidohydrolase [Bacillus rubiinfantis]
MKKTLFYNGLIFTANPKQPYATAMVVEKGRITWVGDNVVLQDFDGEQVDLHNQRVLPGLIDAHMHPLFLANAAGQIACTAPLVHSIEEMLAEVRKKRDQQLAEDWIEGWGYDEGKLAEGRAPNRWDLDKACDDAPVVITRNCTHIISVNSKALELAGITKETPNPPGGEIDRAETGELTGILKENARYLVLQKMPQVMLEDNANRLAEVSPHLLSYGITAVTEMMGLHQPIDYIEMYQSARTKGLRQRTVLYYIWNDMKDKYPLTKQKTNRQEPVHIGGIKCFADGSVSGRTAWVTPPYLGDDTNYGIPTTSKEELLAACQAAEQFEVQLVIHAMGEQAIDLIVDTFKDKKGWLPDGPSIRIEHAAMPTEKAMDLAAKAGIAFVPQPIFLYAEIESYLKNLGSDRTKTTYPVRTFLEKGIKTAFSSDAPATAWAEPADPFVAMKSAVTRVAYDGTDTGQDQRIDVRTAIELYTRYAHEITRIPDIGQLKPGYHADFIVLNEDILSIDVNRLDQIKVMETYMGGEQVYKKQN